MKIHYIEQIGEIVKEICIEFNEEKDGIVVTDLSKLVDDIKSKVKIADTDIDNYTKQFIGKANLAEDNDEDDGEAWKRSVN